MLHVSAAVFSSQTNSFNKSYLAQVRELLLKEELLTPLRCAVFELPLTWQSLAKDNAIIATIPSGLSYAEAFSTWMKTGESRDLETCTTSLIGLPLLAIIHFVQYTQYLKYHKISHKNLLDSIQEGGVHGHCIGLLAAIVVSCSQNEIEVVTNATFAIRLALAIGAYSTVGVDPAHAGSTSLAIRMKEHGFENKILEKFDQASIPIRFSAAHFKFESFSTNKQSRHMYLLYRIQR
jgi:hypothetical protein